MLVVTRRVGQTIEIDGGITLKVMRVRGNQIRLAIDAPPETGIRRGEVKQGVDDQANPNPALEGVLNV